MIETMLKQIAEQLNGLNDQEAQLVSDHFRTLLDKLYEKGYARIEHLDEFDQMLRDRNLMDGDDDPAEG